MACKPKKTVSFCHGKKVQNVTRQLICVTSSQTPSACIYELLYKSQHTISHTSSVDNRQTTVTRFHFNPLIADVATCTILQWYSIALGQLWTNSQYVL